MLAQQHRAGPMLLGQLRQGGVTRIAGHSFQAVAALYLDLHVLYLQGNALLGTERLGMGLEFSCRGLQPMVDVEGHHPLGPDLPGRKQQGGGVRPAAESHRQRRFAVGQSQLTQGLQARMVRAVDRHGASAHAFRPCGCPPWCR